MDSDRANSQHLHVLAVGDAHGGARVGVGHLVELVNQWDDVLGAAGVDHPGLPLQHLGTLSTSAEPEAKMSTRQKRRLAAVAAAATVFAAAAIAVAKKSLAKVAGAGEGAGADADKAGGASEEAELRASSQMRKAGRTVAGEHAGDGVAEHAADFLAPVDELELVAVVPVEEVCEVSSVEILLQASCNMTNSLSMRTKRSFDSGNLDSGQLPTWTASA